MSAGTGSEPLDQALEQYAYGLFCLWHGPAAAADRGPHGTLHCPACGGALMVLPEESWRAQMHHADRLSPGYEQQMRWSQGRCFPDYDTMLSAFRQAMEE